MHDDEEDLVRQVYLLQWQLANLVYNRDRLRRQLEQVEDELKQRRNEHLKSNFPSSRMMTCILVILVAGNLTFYNPVDFLI